MATQSLNHLRITGWCGPLLAVERQTGIEEPRHKTNRLPARAGKPEFQNQVGRRLVRQPRFLEVWRACSFFIGPFLCPCLPCTQCWSYVVSTCLRKHSLSAPINWNIEFLSPPWRQKSNSLIKFTPLPFSDSAVVLTGSLRCPLIKNKWDRDHCLQIFSLSLWHFHH